MRRWHVYFAAIRQNYYNFCCFDRVPDEAQRKKDGVGIYFDVFIEKYLLRAEGGDAGDVCEDEASVKRFLKSMGAHVVPVLKDIYMGLLRVSADEMQSMRRRSQGTTSTATQRLSRVEEFESKVPLLPGEAGKLPTHMNY